MGIARKVYYWLPLGLRKTARRLYFLPKDLFQKEKSGVPPEGKNFTGPGNFEAIGKEFFTYFNQWGNITPASKMLEIGCGMGRMALPFKDYLNQDGLFCGFDIVDEGISWCREKIAPNDERFRFEKVDIYNKLYNPKGKLQSDSFLFPYEDRQFDLIFATSVFTHMLWPGVTHYFSEASRVLKPGGRLIATFFLLDETSIKDRAQNKSFMNFKFPVENGLTIDKNLPESNVAFNMEEVKELAKNVGFKLIDPIHFGSWTGRKEFTSFQDILVWEKLS